VTVTVGTAKPDLVVALLTVPSAAVAGSAISVTDTTKNQGSGFAAASTTKFYLSTNATWEAGDFLLGSRSVPNLAPAASSATTISLTIPSSTTTGNYYIIARADADGVASESSETNNTKAGAIRVSPPDLIVSALSAPAASGAGLTITITDTTKNQTGTGPAGASTTRFFLSTDTVVDAGDQALGSRAIAALAPGAPSSGTTSVTIPAGTLSGTYFILAKADGDNALSEMNEANNLASDTILIGPDLVVSALTVPATGGAGLPITATDTIKNQAGAGAGASTTKFYLSTNSTFGSGDVLLGTRAIPPLALGASNSGSTTLTIPPGTAAGTYYIVAVADADNLVTEADETNNSKSAVIKISPDLIVSVLTGPKTAAAGAIITLSDTTKNQGQGSAIATKTRFFLSANTTWERADPLLGERSVVSLASGQTSSGTTSVTIPAGTAPGSYYILAVADADAEVSESSETNNIKTLPITITGS
jgi:subtilase family serine protease